ncbi:hypothetical protein HDV05_000337 [Chytridiales sp. JEL 0842]|nr:hypothetical protein HDV05_000337 [Chytridiales sp. JEL 0842]
MSLKLLCEIDSIAGIVAGVVASQAGAGKPGPRPIDLPVTLDSLPEKNPQSPFNLRHPSHTHPDYIERRVIYDKDAPNDAEVEVVKSDFQRELERQEAVANPDDNNNNNLTTSAPIVRTRRIDYLRTIKFTPDEDRELLESIREFGFDFKRISVERLPHRIPQVLRKRWDSLNPTVYRGRFTKEEDELLMAAVKSVGKEWALIQRNALSWRSSTQLAARYLILEKVTEATPKSSGTPKRRMPTKEDRGEARQNALRIPWTPEEDAAILRDVVQLGFKWTLIAKAFPGRTPAQLYHRYWDHIYRQSLGYEQKPTPFSVATTTSAAKPLESSSMNQDDLNAPIQKITHMQPWEPWTPAEDQVLFQCLTRLWRTTNRPWVLICEQYLPHRTPSAILKRWQNVVDPRALGCPLTKVEETMLVEAVQRLGPRFAQIAKMKAFEGRTPTSLRWWWERRKHMVVAEGNEEEKETKKDRKKRAKVNDTEKVEEKVSSLKWTKEEDKKILELRTTLQLRYKDMVPFFTNRTDHQIRRRYYSLRDMMESQPMNMTSATTTTEKKTVWTPEEDRYFLSLVDQAQKGLNAFSSGGLRSQTARSLGVKSPRFNGLQDLTNAIRRVYNLPPLTLEQMSQEEQAFKELPYGTLYRISKIMGRHASLVRTKYLQLVSKTRIPETFASRPPTLEDCKAVVVGFDVASPNSLIPWTRLGSLMVPPRSSGAVRGWARRWVRSWSEELDEKLLGAVERLVGKNVVKEWEEEEEKVEEVGGGEFDGAEVDGAGFSKGRMEALSKLFERRAEGIDWKVVGGGMKKYFDVGRESTSKARNVDAERRLLEIEASDVVGRCKRRWIYLQKWQARTGKPVGGAKLESIQQEFEEELGLLCGEGLGYAKTESKIHKAEKVRIAVEEKLEKLKSKFH